MTRSVTWSPVAKRSYYQILEYLEEHWTQKELSAFINRTEEAIGHSCENPLLYPNSKKSDTYKCV